MHGLSPPLPLRLDNPLANGAAVDRGSVHGPCGRRGVSRRLLIWPVHLSADYSFPQFALATSARRPARRSRDVAVLLVAGALAVWGWFRERHVCFAIAFAGAHLLDRVQRRRPDRDDPGASGCSTSRRPGFCLLLAFGITTSARGPAASERRTVALAALVVALYARAHHRAQHGVARRADVLPAMVADAPRSARSHRELALLLSDENRHDEAVAEIETSLRLAPDEPMTLYDLGNVLARADRYPDAIDAYERALDAQARSDERLRQPRQRVQRARRRGRGRGAYSAAASTVDPRRGRPAPEPRQRAPAPGPPAPRPRPSIARRSGSRRATPSRG